MGCPVHVRGRAERHLRGRVRVQFEGKRCDLASCQWDAAEPQRDVARRHQKLEAVESSQTSLSVFIRFSLSLSPFFFKKKYFIRPHAWLRTHSLYNILHFNFILLMTADLDSRVKPPPAVSGLGDAPGLRGTALHSRPVLESGLCQVPPRAPSSLLRTTSALNRRPPSPRRPLSTSRLLDALLHT